MKYLTVGTKEITENQFYNVEDIDMLSHVKPRGGLWLTEQYDNSGTYNCWVDYLLENPRVLYYKNKSPNLWVQPCSLVTLKDNIKIFTLDDLKKLQYLIEKYPYNNKNIKFSYQELSKDYDGFFIKLFDLTSQMKDYDMKENYRKFSVDSLLLFNLNCIDYYQSGVVDIEPFELGYRKFDYYYEIKCDEEKKRVLKR